ncbi:MAG: hypothetical protein AAGD38_09215 [Acidobacteriota bacterium]
MSDRPLSHRVLPLVLPALALLVYGRHIGDGFLSDDFLYATWATEGVGELLRRVTIDSEPQMIRPLPALAWLLPDDATVQHLLSILLHGLTAMLVAVGARRLGAARADGLLLGGLFVLFPLFTEPVIWLSSAADLWATAFALGALVLALPSEDGRRRPVAAVCLFALALLCKVSVLLLPLIVLVLAPRRVGITLGALGTTAALYLGTRWWLFSGLGGYRDASGQTLLAHLDPLLFVRNLFAQIPFRVLVPVKPPVEPLWWLMIAGVTVATGVVIVVTLELWRRPKPLIAALIVFVLAALPVAPIVGVSPDHENSRLIYFPIAVLLVALGAAWRPHKMARASVAILGVMWLGLTLFNAQSWRVASLEVRHSLELLAKAQRDLGSGATVFMAGHDTYRGAYTWRNGFGHAAALQGLRDDVGWLHGSAAMVAQQERVGNDVVEWQLATTASGGYRLDDYTGCQRALRQATPLRSVELAGGSASPVQQRGRIHVDALDSQDTQAFLLVPPPGDSPRIVEGWFYWRGPDDASFSRQRARQFVLGDEPIVVRLSSPVPEQLDLRIETTDPNDLNRLARLDVLPHIDACAAGSVPSIEILQ